jgi:hypothetical protein
VKVITNDEFGNVQVERIYFKLSGNKWSTPRKVPGITHGHEAPNYKSILHASLKEPVQQLTGEL